MADLKSKIKNLTDRDILVVQLLADDYRPADMVNKIPILRKTIEKNIADLRLTFGCNTVGGLVALFYRNKLIK